MLNYLGNLRPAEVVVLPSVQGFSNTFMNAAQNEENYRYCC